MKIKKSKLYFYELLRDFLYKYLIVQCKFTEAAVKNYTNSLDQYRQYLRSQKKIPFDKVEFYCFTKEMVYDFCIWLRDSESKAINTINLRLSAIKSSFPERLHYHVFRHSIGMAMFKAGIPLSYIKDFLGHSSIDFQHQSTLVQTMRQWQPHFVL